MYQSITRSINQSTRKGTIMEVGIRYVITMGGDDGTLEVGDRIRLEPNGNITCANAMAWISANDVLDALQGAEYEVDNSAVAKSVWDSCRKPEAQSQLISPKAFDLLYQSFD
jgi:hypothetical protein